ncbi:MAG: prefoldin subunit alpha [Candidatus Bathyarchaeia archaeon]
MSSKVEDELRRLSVEIRFLEQTAEALSSRINMVNAAIADLTYAMMTMEGLEKQKGSMEILVPIGGNSYINAKIESVDKVTIGIGAGVSVEKSLQEAKEMINRRLEELEKSKDSLQQQLSQVAEKINEDRERFEELAAKITAKEHPSKNV